MITSDVYHGALDFLNAWLPRNCYDEKHFARYYTGDTSKTTMTIKVITILQYLAILSCYV